MIPLSYAQRRMWFINRFEGPSSTYNIPLLLRFRGPLDTAALRGAFQDVMERHEVLRTVFEEVDGQPFQRILDPAGIEPPWKDWGRVAPDRVPGVVASVTGSWFDLSADVPLRGCVLQTGDEEFVLVLVIHHIAGDGGSLAPLARDVSAAYRARVTGAAPDWSELPVQYSDYALWQREMLGDEDDPGSVLAVQTAYWREELAGVSKPLPLPLDRQRPAVAGFRGESVPAGLPAELFAEVQRLARTRGVTVSMVLQAALVVLLHRLGGGRDVTLGSPIAGRTDEALNELVGFFVNTWTLRVQVRPERSFDWVLEQVRRKALAAYDNQDVPFERLVESLRPERSTAHHPLFQVVFAWQNNTAPHLDLPGLEVTMEPLPTGSAKFDLFFNLAPTSPPAPSGARSSTPPTSSTAPRWRRSRRGSRRSSRRPWPTPPPPPAGRPRAGTGPGSGSTPPNAGRSSSTGTTPPAPSPAPGRSICSSRSRPHGARTRSRCAGPAAPWPTAS
ncbi:condensation domain-containing protein [Streptomyces sp. I6]|uniref:condensation domain-containing protein n=1 Tax=Streptomyces sp. I6 TaxID=2483113 RepID=UPI000F446B07|nr:condensation domain-containing protein [Streptomyces sp. I6]RNL73104.1 hypothetical protein EBF04_23335 [Streptomyces sp. I6]